MGLFLVPTPIGNFRDLSPRAIEVLSRANIVAAEDTRVALKLFGELGIKGPKVVSHHEHNEEKQAGRLVEKLLAGADIALISDAGTPLVSDPGFRLVVAALEAGIDVVPLPGPNAAITALIASGLPPDRFRFVGFLPRQSSKRRAALENLKSDPDTIVLYEAPRRALETLADVAELLDDRRVCLAISLTKKWERFHRGPASDVRRALESEGEIKGEMCLVIAGFSGERGDRERAMAVVEGLAKAGVRAGVIRDVVSEAFGLPRREIYQAALALRD